MKLYLSFETVKIEKEIHIQLDLRGFDEVSNSKMDYLTQDMTHDEQTLFGALLYVHDGNTWINNDIWMSRPNKLEWKDYKMTSKKSYGAWLDVVLNHIEFYIKNVFEDKVDITPDLLTELENKLNSQDIEVLFEYVSE